MRLTRWFQFGLILAVTLAGRPVRAAEDSTTARGGDPAYETLGELAVMHDRRVMPLDTLARQKVKQIYGRETVKLVGEDGKPRAQWGPVAALFDWSVRPEFWDDQDFILVDYIPLKERLLAEPIRARLKAIADRSGTPDPLKSELRRQMDAEVFTASDLRDLTTRPGLDPADRQALNDLAAKLNEGHRWLSPRELEEARVRVEGKLIPFPSWFSDLRTRKAEADAPMIRSARLSTLESRAYDTGVRLSHYQAIRGDQGVLVEPLNLVVPPPHDDVFLKFLYDSAMKAYEAQQAHGTSEAAPSSLELYAADLLMKFLNPAQDKDRRALLGYMKALKPGEPAPEAPEVVTSFREWLQQNADWAPLPVLLKTEREELQRAGYPYREVGALRASYDDLTKAEEANPGRVPIERAAAVVRAAREVGEAVNTYPSPEAIARETHFNRLSPFYYAPMIYGLALAGLVLSLVLTNLPGGSERGSTLGLFNRAIYSLGLLGMVGGLALEAYGFYLRVRISGWAPVTNMYETVIWVSGVVVIFGLGLELISRKVYAATAAAALALVTTVLAYNVSLLDPNIRALPPVLRDNFWLTIHVLTIVSSYAAFALAMGLGLIATLFYLTATYRRSPGLAELAAPVVPGLPVLGLGLLGLAASQGGWGPTWFSGQVASTISAVVAGLGGVLTIMGSGAVVGELINRIAFPTPAEDSADPATLAGVAPESVAPGGPRPTVAEIRARQEAARPLLDARARASQATAAVLKPLANLIYRAMQVGVLLVAAGTILGGVWADVSWGRFWGWDPKEVWALITLLVYLVPLHGRFAGWINTFGLTVASVACFLSVLMAWYGVNFVLPVGLHSYGFTEGGGQGVVAATSAAILAVVFAAGWRRGLAKKMG